MNIIDRFKVKVYTSYHPRTRVGKKIKEIILSR